MQANNHNVAPPNSFTLQSYFLTPQPVASATVRKVDPLRDVKLPPFTTIIDHPHKESMSHAIQVLRTAEER